MIELLEAIKKNESSVSFISSSNRDARSYYLNNIDQANRIYNIIKNRGGDINQNAINNMITILTDDYNHFIEPVKGSDKSKLR